MIGKLERYGLHNTWADGWVDDSGEWVKYADHRAHEDALLSELKRVLEPGACPKAALDLIRQIEAAR